MSKITILGEGAWGTAIATVLAENNHEVLLWCHDKTVYENIIKNRCNTTYLPDIELSSLITPTTDLNYAVTHSSWIFEAIPVKFLRSVIMHIDPQTARNKQWCILSKGIEKNTLLFPAQIITELIGDYPYVVLSGPSFAQELAHHQITAVIIASFQESWGIQAKELLENHYFRPYLSSDVIGVQIGGALKNVIALMIGVLSGAGYGDNTKAFIMTRGFQEIALLASACGAQKETLYGLSGIGDLIATTFGKLSKNTTTGVKLGEGQSLKTIIQQTGVLPEGINTLESVRQLVQKKNLRLPLLLGIYDVVFNNLSLQNFITQTAKAPILEMD